MQHNSLLNNHQPDIGVLLEKYFDGETSIAEEKVLKGYFNAPGVAPEHQAMAPLFQMLSKEKAAVMPEKGKASMPDLSSQRSVGLSSQRSVGTHWPKYMAAAATMLLLITAAAWWWTSRPDALLTDRPIAAVPNENGADPTLRRDDKKVSENGTDPTLRRDDKKVSENGTDPTLRRDDKRALVNQKRKSKVRKQAQPVLASQIDPETEEAMEEIKAAFALISSKINKGRKEAAKGLKEMEHVEKGIEKIKVNS